MTAANESDIEHQEGLLRSAQEGGRDVYKDASYVSQDKDESLRQQGLRSHTHERGTREHPLTALQKQMNTSKSRIRARVEHVFGAMQNEMGGKRVRSIGLSRAQCNLVLKNLTYNLKRTVSLLNMKFWEGIDRIVAPAADGSESMKAKTA